MFLKNLFVSLGVMGISALSFATPSQAASGTIKVTNNSPQSVAISGYSASPSVTTQSTSLTIAAGITTDVANASGPEQTDLSRVFTSTSNDNTFGCNYYATLTCQSTLNQYFSNYILYSITRI